jgi:ribosomal protein L32
VSVSGDSRRRANQRRCHDAEEVTNFVIASEAKQSILL